MSESKFDLEERLIDFAVEIVLFSESLPNTKAGSHLGGQLLRSGTSPSLNYGEVRAAESKKDFIHKMKICLKELRETYNNLRILKKIQICSGEDLIEKLVNECNELISIFVSSIHTASKSENKS